MDSSREERGDIFAEINYDGCVFVEVGSIMARILSLLLKRLSVLLSTGPFNRTLKQKLTNLTNNVIDGMVPLSTVVITRKYVACLLRE